MKLFSELNIIYFNYNCKLYKLESLVGIDLDILDYKPNIKTKYGERYLVLFRSESLGQGKFFTSSRPLKYCLDRIREAEELPFRTKIIKESIGDGKSRYIFS